MAIRPIRSRLDLEAALARIEVLWGAPSGTPEGDELDVLVTLVEAYEAAHHEIPPGDPIEVIRYKMGELGLSQNALAARLGWSSGRVSEVLGRKRALTLAMIRALADALTLPPGLLVGGERVPGAELQAVRLPRALLERVRQECPTAEELEDRLARLIELGLGGRKRAAVRLPRDDGRDGANSPWPRQVAPSPHSRFAA